MYAVEYLGSGTTVMRGEQLSSIARHAMPRSDVSFAPMSRRFRSQQLFLTKGVLKSASHEDFSRWRDSGNRIFVDPVDESIPDGVVEFADVIVAASRSAAADYRDRYPRHQVALLDHHVDPRIAPIISHSARPVNARIGYFGELANAFHSQQIESRVDFIPVDTSRQDPGWLTKLPHYSAHYAVRQARQLDEHKPFLKGFTAAACEAIVVVDRTQRESHHWLPPDYPYWVDQVGGDQSVTEALDRVREGFGSAEWKSARDSMRLVAAETSPERIRDQLRTLFA